MILPLRFFDTRSVLFRNMQEYLLTIDSLSLLDRQVIIPIVESDEATSADDLAMRLNAQFNTTNQPVLGLLYTAERLAFWRLKDGAKQKLRNCYERLTCPHCPISVNFGNFAKDILDPLTIRGLPPNITAESVRFEWEKYERHEAGTGQSLNGVKTEILSMAFDPDFDFLPTENDEEQSEPAMSKEMKRAVLQHMLDHPAFDHDMIALIAFAGQVADKTGYDKSQVFRYIKYFRNLFCVQADIAYELARINRRKILTIPKLIVGTRGLAGVHARTESVRVFYKLMREWFRGLPADTQVFGKASIVCIEPSIWKDHFIKPLLSSVGESV